MKQIINLPRCLSKDIFFYLYLLLKIVNSNAVAKRSCWSYLKNCKDSDGVDPISHTVLCQKTFFQIFKRVQLIKAII